MHIAGLACTADVDAHQAAACSLVLLLRWPTQNTPPVGLQSLLMPDMALAAAMGAAAVHKRSFLHKRAPGIALACEHWCTVTTWSLSSSLGGMPCAEVGGLRVLVAWHRLQHHTGQRLRMPQGSCMTCFNRQGRRSPWRRCHKGCPAIPHDSAPQCGAMSRLSCALGSDFEGQSVCARALG